MTVRTAAEPSAPARDGGRGRSLDGAHRRREREPDGADRRRRPRPRATAADGERDHRDGGGDQRAEDEEQLLQPGLERVGGVAQALRREQARPERAHAGAERRQRRSGQRGAGRQGDDRARPAWRAAPGRRTPPDRRRRAAAAHAPARCGRRAGPRAASRSRWRATTRRRPRPRRRTSGPRRAAAAPSRAAPCRSAAGRAARRRRRARRRARASTSA